VFLLEKLLLIVIKCFFFQRLDSPLGAIGRLIFRGFTITLRHITRGRTPLDQWSARHRDLYLTTQNTHKRQTSMPSAGFESTIPVSERSQTHALDRRPLIIVRWGLSVRSEILNSSRQSETVSWTKMPRALCPRGRYNFFELGGGGILHIRRPLWNLDDNLGNVTVQTIHALQHLCRSCRKNRQCEVPDSLRNVMQVMCMLVTWLQSLPFE
jgi:hypothetical protein